MKLTTILLNSTEGQNHALLKTLLCFFIFSCGSFSLFAQDCNASVFMKEGNTLEYAQYNKKGKVLSTGVHETIEVDRDGSMATAIIKTTVNDQKEKNTFSMEYKAYCENGVFSIDMLRSFDTSKLLQYEGSDLSVEIDGDVLSFPVDMTPGQELDDGTITVKVNNDNFTLVTMVMNITNRKILDNETVTTPAGTFECQKITFDFESKFGIIKARGSGVEWYLEDKVIVKTESYNKNGKLIGYTELTKM